MAMADHQSNKKTVATNGVAGFWSSLFSSLLRDLMKLIVIFALGTLGGAMICLYYGFPIVFSFVGGIAIFVIAVAAFINS
jgi:hypothetical protein